MTQTPPPSAVKRASKNKPDANNAEKPVAPAQHIWLAGLGAMAKAQEEGSKAIEALINDGLAFQRKSQAEAQQRMQEATEKLTNLASDLSQPGAGRTDRLEHLFEDRVAKALHRLGIPTLADLQSLNERLDRIERLLIPPSPAARPKTPTARPKQLAPTNALGGKKSPAKSASKNKAGSDATAPVKTSKARRTADRSSGA
jgi:poly(hydroxyalkanoate) granule-associated protein